jgi:hypothetical protein
MPTPLWKPSAAGLTKTPQSGKLTLSDRSTLVDSYDGTYANCVAAKISRGTYGTGARADWVCTMCEVDPDRGDKARLTITWEAAGPNSGIDLPSSDFDLQTQELYPKVERNAYFSGITSATLALAYTAAQGSTPQSRASANTQLAGLSDPQKTLGQKLASKLLAGTETFYLAGLRYTWWEFTWTIPTLSAGGSLATPGGPLSGKFGTMQFLRLCDIVTPAGVNGSMFKHTLTYLGGPNGHWDSDLY